MPTLPFEDVTVEFPHEPYACQLEYMKKLLQSLKQAEHAILESPTGTGKTLCLLCTSLAWLATESATKMSNEPFCAETSTLVEIKNKPKVIFASRTHSQLAQAVEVLKRTAYSNRNISVIGSRDQLCLLPEVVSLESNSAKIFGCRSRVQTRTCEYYRNFDLKRDNLLNIMRANGVVDIEDLVKFGNSMRCCPYYMSRELKTTADIIFMPYNYLLDPKIRRLYNVELENAAVIFDEAHNIEQVCEDAASVTLTSSLLAAAIEYIRVVCEAVFSLTAQADADEGTTSTDFASGHLLSSFDISRAGEDKLGSLNLEKLLSLKGQLIELERLIDTLDITESGMTKPSEFLFDLLGRAGFTSQTTELALHTVDEILSVATAAENAKLRRPKGIGEVSEFLKTVFESRHPPAQSTLLPLFRPQNIDYSRCYRLFVKDEPLHGRGSVAAVDGNRIWDSHTGTNKFTTNRTLSYWCLSPGRAMQDLVREQVRCVILTSGTLYPVEPIQAELRMKFPNLLQNPHVITQEQVRLAVITRGKDGEPLNSSYATREKPGYRKALGHTLVDLMKIVPNGLLVFFPSYVMMTQCIDAWKNTGLEAQMSCHKRIFVEPRDKVQFAKVFAEYRNVACGLEVSNTHGAALFAVMRGRASEGLDLADYAGRGVAVLGLPYPPYHDPRVRLKMAYLDEQLTQLRNQAAAVTTASVCKSPMGLEKNLASFPTGRKWYNQQAWRAVNQSIGRVIRHNRDFGAVFLCDERFAPSNARSELPCWMQPSLRVYSEHDVLINETVTFFKHAAILHPPPKQSFQDTRNVLVESSQRNFLGKRSHSIKAFDLSNIPRANETQTFAHSLALKVPAVDADTLLANYVSSDSKTMPATTENQLNNTSVFARIEVTTEHDYQANSLIDGAEETEYDALESKLSRAKPGKRLKIDHGAEKRESSLQFFVEPATYVQAVKTFFLQQNHDRNSLRKFKDAIKDYRAQGLQTDLTLSKDSSRDCVRKLYATLSPLFDRSETLHLLQGASCLLSPVHRQIFNALCTTRVECGSSEATVTIQQLKSSSGSAEFSPEYRITCCKCHVCPPRTPLVSTCKHVACFGCWRSVIEEGNHRCPTCRTLLRRRMLTRLIHTTSTENSIEND